MRKSILVMAALLIAMVIAGIAAAQAQSGSCSPRQKVVDTLAQKYKESRRSIGVATKGRVMELFASESGSWTIVVTYPNGMTCLVASGQAFEAVDEALEPTEMRL